VDRIDECLEKDVWYLRLLAKLARSADGDDVGQAGPGVPSTSNVYNDVSNGKAAKKK